MQASELDGALSGVDGYGAPELEVRAGEAPQRVSVLVIEDDDADFRITRSALHAMDALAATVHHARSLGEARAALQRGSFDVALVDFNLGLESGISALRDLGGRHGSVAPILLTGMPGADVKQTALQAGAIYCLDKGELSPGLMESTIRCTLHTFALERRLQDLVIELERANRARSDFFAKIGHDLKTPLNAIIGYSDALAVEAFGPVGQVAYRDAGERIKESGLHLLEVIDNLIQHSLSQGELGAGTFDTEDVNELVERALGMVDILRRKREHTLTKKLSERPVHVSCQRSTLTQAVLNVLSNAIKYTPNGGNSCVGVMQAGRYVEIRIRDDGIGMSDRDVAIALAPFGRVELPAPLAQDGTGIGLPIVRDIMARHEGQLEIESAPGEGTIIVLRLPARATARRAA